MALDGTGKYPCSEKLEPLLHLFKNTIKEVEFQALANPIRFGALLKKPLPPITICLPTGFKKVVVAQH